MFETRRLLRIFKSNTSDTRTPAAKAAPVLKEETLSLNQIYINTVVQFRHGPATTGEYADWIEAHLKRGGKIARYAPQDMKDVFVALQDMDVPRFDGPAWRLKILAAPGVTLTPFPSEGDNVLMHADGELKGNAKIVLYADTVEELKRRGYSIDERAIGTPQANIIPPQRQLASAGNSPRL